MAAAFDEMTVVFNRTILVLGKSECKAVAISVLLVAELPTTVPVLGDVDWLPEAFVSCVVNTSDVTDLDWLPELFASGVVTNDTWDVTDLEDSVCEYEVWVICGFVVSKFSVTAVVLDSVELHTVSVATDVVTDLDVVKLAASEYRKKKPRHKMKCCRGIQ